MKLQNQQYTFLLWMWLVALWFSPLNHDLIRYGISPGLTWNDNGWIFIFPIIFTFIFSWARREILMSKKNVQFILPAMLIFFIAILFGSGESWHTTQIVRWLLFLLVPMVIWPMCKRTPLLFSLSLLGLLALQSQWAILQFSLQHDLHLLFLGETHLSPTVTGVAKFLALGHKLIRAYGPYQHANILAGSLLVSMMLGLSMVLGRLKNEVFYVFVTTFFLGLALLLSFSRLAAISLAIWLALTWLWQRFRHVSLPFLVKRLGWIALCLLVLLCPLFVFRSADPEDTALSDRTHGYAWALAIGQATHGQGVGIGNYPSFLKTYLDSRELTYQSWDIAYVHNSLLLMMLEWGLVPASAFILLGLYTLFRFWPADRTVELFILIVSCLPIIFFDHYLITATTPLILLELMVMVMRQLYLRPDWQPETETVS